MLANAVVGRRAGLKFADAADGVHAGGGVQAVVQELRVFAAVHALVHVLDDHLIRCTTKVVVSTRACIRALG